MGDQHFTRLGAISECEYHGWMQDRADPHARNRPVEMARQDPPPGLFQMPLQHRCGKSWSQSATPAQSVPRTSGTRLLLNQGSDTRNHRLDRKWLRHHRHPWA